MYVVKDKDPQPPELEEEPEEEQQSNPAPINEQEYKTLIEEETYDLDKFNKEHPYIPKFQLYLKIYLHIYQHMRNELC